MELDLLYVDTAICRWQRFAGLKARLDASGKSLEDMLQSRNPQTEMAHD